MPPEDATPTDPTGTMPTGVGPGDDIIEESEHPDLPLTADEPEEPGS